MSLAIIVGSRQKLKGYFTIFIEWGHCHTYNIEGICNLDLAVVKEAKLLFLGQAQ